MNHSEFEALIKRFEDPQREAWQKPDSVIAMLGDLRGATVVDIGSGSGYFAFRLAGKAAKVIAADVDDRFLRYIEARKKQAGISDAKLETRKIPYTAPGLTSREVDAVLMVNTYHHIEDRANYFTKVKRGLKEGGKLVIVDFKPGNIPVGPPEEMRVAASKAVAELRQAGFGRVSVDSQTLPYQYILVAQ